MHQRFKCNTFRKNIEKNIQNLSLGKQFLDLSPTAQNYKEKINILNFIKIKNFCSATDPIKTKRQATYLEQLDVGLNYRTEKVFFILEFAD